MTKFRSHHSKAKRKGFDIIFPRVILLILFTIGVLVWLFKSDNNKNISKHLVPRSYAHLGEELIPTCKGCDHYFHKYYDYGYNESFEQSEWVAYKLTKESLLVPNVKRHRKFEIDKQVITGSSSHSDYKNSGFTRGHLVPAADMAFSKEAMKQTFLMSNISPQLASFNSGVWRELEEQTREWALEKDSVFIISGPIIGESFDYIGKKNKIRVPSSFYKVICDMPNKDCISFLIPHAKQEARLSEFLVTIDEIEKKSGLNLFPELENSESMESRFKKQNWLINEDLYHERHKYLK